MKIALVAVTPRRSPKSASAEVLAHDYLQRCSRYLPTEDLLFPTEDAFFRSLEKAHSPANLILLDPRGKLLSSEDFAHHLGRLRDTGTQRALLAIGPADGWTDTARAPADLLLSLGPMTLPHELARVVLAEQLYRALTILAGHPYHSGH